MAAGRAPLEFPATVGPFTTSRVNLARAFEAFYRQHQFPKPDPASDENSMAGMDLTVVGIRVQDIVFCQLSPLHAITLGREAKEDAGMPGDADYFAFAYPAVLDNAALAAAAGAAERAFLEYGGYLYLNERQAIVGTDSICPAALGTPGLMFGRPQALPSGVAETLTRQGRFQEIARAEWQQRGATHFAWIRPAEFSESVASANGCFAYKFAGMPPKYFPVVDRPVYTQAVLDEVLEGREAWVVIRTVKPSIEVMLIFDKALTMAENAANTHSVELLRAGVGVLVSRDSGGAGSAVAYEEWQQTAEPGTVADPWVFHTALADSGAAA